MKFKTNKECFHNGKYYNEGDIVECDCKLCKEGKVSYFVSLEENKQVEEKVEEEVKEQVKEQAGEELELTEKLTENANKGKVEEPTKEPTKEPRGLKKIKIIQ